MLQSNLRQNNTLSMRFLCVRFFLSGPMKNNHHILKGIYEEQGGCPCHHKKSTNNSHLFCHVISICPEKELTGRFTDPERKLLERSSLSRRRVSMKTKKAFLPSLSARSPSYACSLAILTSSSSDSLSLSLSRLDLRYGYVQYSVRFVRFRFRI